MHYNLRFTLPMLLLASCGGILTGVDTVDSMPQVEIRTLESVYRPLELAVAVIHNAGAEPIFRDPCAGKIEGRRTASAPWNGSYGSGRACALTGGQEYPKPVQIGPGESMSDTLHINSLAYEGEWRFQFQLFDARGKLLPLEQRVSNIFQVVR